MKTLKLITEGMFADSIHEGMFDVDDNLDAVSDELMADKLHEIEKIFSITDPKDVVWDQYNDLTIVEPKIDPGYKILKNTIKDILGTPLDTLNIVDAAAIRTPYDITFSPKEYFKNLNISCKYGSTLNNNYDGIKLNYDIGLNEIQVRGKMINCDFTVSGSQSNKKYINMSFAGPGECKGLLQGTTIHSDSPIYTEIVKTPMRKSDFEKAIGELYTRYPKFPEKDAKWRGKKRMLTKIKFSKKSEWCNAGTVEWGGDLYITQKEIDNILGFLGCKLKAELRGMLINFYEERCKIFIKRIDNNLYECSLRRRDQ